MSYQTAAATYLGPRPSLATGIIVLAAIGFGLAPLFARGLIEAGMASAAIALYRYAGTALIAAPATKRRTVRSRAALWALGAGLAMGLGWIGYVEALKVAPVAAAGVIYMTYPLFALLGAWILIGERPGKRSILGAVMILGAAVLALSPGSLGPDAVLALLLSFGAPLTFGTAIAILTGKLQSLSPMERVFFAGLGASLGLIPVALGQDTASLFPDTAGQAALILGIAVATALIPQLLYVIAAPVVGTARTAMAGSVELPTMFLVGWLAFGETITGLEIVAGILVVTAIVITPPIAPPATVTPAVDDS